VELEGFLANSVLRLAGFSVKAQNPLPEVEEEEKVLQLIEQSLVEFLRRTFPDCHTTVAPATVSHSPAL
jgi:hypothetical protein